MNSDIIEMFRQKNKQILITTLGYDIEKNMTSLLETITNIFNLEFDNAIKNIISIYEDANLFDSKKFITDTINQIKMDSYCEFEQLLDNKKVKLEKVIGEMEFDQTHINNYYDTVLDTTTVLETDLKKYSISDVQKKAYDVFMKQIDSLDNVDKQDILLSRIQDYLFNRLYGKLENKIHMELTLRDNNLINKAKEGYLRYQEICSKTEEK